MKRSGHPQLSNVLYLWDGDQRTAKITTTETRLKARNLRRNPNAAPYVAGTHFWSYAVAEGTAKLSAVSRPLRVTTPAVSCASFIRL